MGLWGAAHGCGVNPRGDLGVTVRKGRQSITQGQLFLLPAPVSELPVPPVAVMVLGGEGSPKTVGCHPVTEPPFPGAARILVIPAE